MTGATRHGGSAPLNCLGSYPASQDSQIDSATRQRLGSYPASQDSQIDSATRHGGSAHFVLAPPMTPCISSITVHPAHFVLV